MKKWFRSFLLCFTFFLSFILIDIHAFNFGLISYRSIFQSDLSSLISYNWMDLIKYIGKYFLIYNLFCLYISIIISSYRDINRKMIFAGAIFINILVYSALKFPQIYYSVFKFDYWISQIPISILIISFALSIIFIFYIHIRSTQNKLIHSAMLIAYFATQVSQLFNFNIDRNDPYKIKNESLIVISLDSIRSDSFIDIKKYAKGTFKKYLELATHSQNIIADNTQTRESFHALLTGQNLFTLRNRYPFSDSFESENQDQLFFLKELQQKNYRTIFLRDEQETVQLNSGPAIDKVITTAPIEKLSILVNKVSHSFVLFQLLPHFISERIIPSSFNTSSQTLGYDPQKIVSRIIQSMVTASQESAAMNKNSFFFIHSCISHTPVKLPFPYNIGLTPPKDGFESYSYSDFRNYPSIVDSDLIAQRYNYDKLYYTRMVQFVTEKYLNPLFDQIQKAGAYQPEKIILISDHGENFWSGRELLPIRKNYPFHGDTDLFGATADKPLFISTTKFDNPDELLNLSQAMGLIINKKKPSNIVYTENSFSLSDETKDFLHWIDYSVFVKAYNKFKSKSAMYIDSSFDLAISLYLQKSFYDGHLKITFYRTPTGRKAFVCDYKLDRECADNLWLTQKSNRKRWVKTYNQILFNDIQIQKDVPVRLNNQMDIDHYSEMENARAAKNQWLNLYAALLNFTLKDNTQELYEIKNSIQHHELILYAYEQVKNRYWFQLENDFSDNLLKYESWESVNNLVMSNRIEKYVLSRYPLSTQKTIRQQLITLPPDQKYQLYKELERELDHLFKYAFSYQLPYQTESYLILLFKFAIDLDQKHLAKEIYIKKKSNFDTTARFRRNIEKFIEKIPN